MVEVQHSTVLDPGLEHLGTVYAKGLLAATERAGKTDEVLAELDSLVDDVLPKLPQFEASLASPRVSFDAKERLIDKAFRGRASTEFLNFIKVLTRRGRFKAVRAVRVAARRLLNELRRRMEVHLVTAAELDQVTQDMIVQKLKTSFGQDVDLRVKVDPDLIGGMLIRIGDTVYDGSIANQLKQLRSELVARSAQTLRAQSERFAVAN